MPLYSRPRSILSTSRGSDTTHTVLLSRVSLAHIWHISPSVRFWHTSSAIPRVFPPQEKYAIRVPPEPDASEEDQLRFIIRQAEDMESEPLRALSADPGQGREFIYKVFK